MRYFPNIRAIGFACLLLAAGTLSPAAGAAPERATAASAASMMLAFNPQPDPPGADDVFDHG